MTPTRHLARAFDAFAARSSELAGSSWASGAAVLVVVAWASFGPASGWSDTHLLIINTVTTIVTFLMVFLIQHAQDKGSRAVQAKLDELILRTRETRDEVAGIEDLPEDELDAVRGRIREGR